MTAAVAYPIRCIGIPKTVDNDLPITDCSPGFGSLGKYAAISVRRAAFDLAGMSRTSTRVFALELMGRHAGSVTAACALASEQEGDAPPILLLLPLTFGNGLCWGFFDAFRGLSRVQSDADNYDHTTHLRTG